jgi:hypothetical protein
MDERFMHDHALRATTMAWRYLLIAGREPAPWHFDQANQLIQVKGLRQKESI